MVDLAALTPTQNSNARRVKRLVDASSVRATAQALGISEESVRLAIRIADALDDAEVMWDIHNERSNA